MFRILLCLFCICLASGHAEPSQEIQDRKTVIVTGASGELGSATAKLLARDYNLILTGRDIPKLQKLQSELKTSYPGRYEIQSLDYVSSNSIANFKEYLKKSDTVISGLVLIAPRPQFYGKALLQEEKTWHEVFTATFTGPLEVLKVVLPQIKQHGKIVVIAGTTSVQFQPDSGPTCVIRRMWTTYAKALSHDLGRQGITVNTLSPGIILTNFHQERIQKKADTNHISYDAAMEQDVASIPLHRHGNPQEVAQTIRFLISDDADFINGINLVLDGGFTTSY